MRNRRPDDLSVSAEQDLADQDLAHQGFVAQWMSASPGAALDVAQLEGSVAAGGRPGGVVKSYTSGSAAVDDSNEFNIQINFSGRWTADQQAVVKWAADFFSQLITDDVRDDTDLNSNLVDDIVITISTGNIDGKGSPITGGNTLAQTGDIVTRDNDTVDEWIPLTASIKLDSADLRDASLAGTWDAIILHEMGHALGFVGVIFDQLGLADDLGNFIGTNAMIAYGGLVPLEDSGGTATAGSHWDEANFAPGGETMSNELMTGFFVPGEVTLLSDTTIGAFDDIGYVVQDLSPDSTSLILDSHLLIA